MPLKRTQRFAAVGAESTAIVLIRIKTKHGVEGIGEACTPSGPWWGGESVESIKLMIDTYITPLIIGEDPFNIISIMNKLNRKLFGNAFAKAAVEMALLDIQGKSLGAPVYDLLGGKQRGELYCSWPLATGVPEDEIDEALQRIEARQFNNFKLKMGFLGPQEDVRRACDVARGLAGKANVRVDPNEMWDEVTAKWAIPRLEDAGIEFIEQPMARWNIEGSARLTERSNVAIMLDESICTPEDMVRIVNTHAADVVSLKLMKSSGIHSTKKIADIAMAGGVAVYMGTFLECSIGTAANMQFAATLAHLPFGGELSGPCLVAEDIAVRPARYENFALQLEDGVGIAVEVDEDKVRAFDRDSNYTLHQVAKTGTR